MDANSNSHCSASILLERPFEGRVAGGVAAGISKLLEIDVLIIRALFVVFSCLGRIGVALYLGAAALLAEVGAKDSVAAEVRLRSWVK